MHAHNSAFSISTKSGTARELGWGPGNANSHSRGRATPGVLTEGLWAAKAIFGMPISITLCLLMVFISPVCCSEHGTPLHLMLTFPGMVQAELN